MRILIVRLSHLGDVVHALGLHHALHEAYPSAEIAWAIQPEFAELVEGLPGLSRVVTFGRRQGWRAWPRLRKELLAFDADLAVDCQGNLKSAGVVLASGAPTRVGPARADWREPLGARVLTEEAAAVPGGAKHAMDRTAALVRHLLPSRSGSLRLDPGLSRAERDDGERELALRLPADGTRPALLHLTSSEDIRGWPLSHWEALVRRLAAAKRRTLVLSGPGEAEVGRALERQVPDVALVSHWVGQRGLRLLSAVFAAAARRGAALVGCDSGPAHLAAANGLPVVLLAGPQDPTRTGPWPPGPRGPHVAVRARQRPACQPCLSRQCAHNEGPICMSRIEPQDVLAALTQVSPARTHSAAIALATVESPAAGGTGAPHDHASRAGGVR